MDLTIKQERFCLEYAKSGNARQAYIKAGYKTRSDEVTDSSASRLLRNEKVQKRLEELSEEIKNSNIADITEMQERLTAIIRSQTLEEILITEGKGNGITKARSVEKKPDIKDIINAINTLGKMQGAFTDKVNLTGAIPVVITGGDDLEE